jgi:hypothetical protein
MVFQRKPEQKCRLKKGKEDAYWRQENGKKPFAKKGMNCLALDAKYVETLLECACIEKMDNCMEVALLKYCVL